ncbi:polycystic kidney disease protein 1-like 1 isoform X1 [Nomascus leucogenys]|uniref:polycystic kidney disease protein 1-like 1 isoform X1 n=2 Tax=Nomascus leucogenys TaxID=61853 RepID=UPI00122D7BA5|nr:polycystic kidney disease protein 1-like 1 isoform X1 [Nomascus leucogenys]
MAEEAAQNISDDQERCLQAACCLSFGGELSVSTDKSWGLHLCSCSPPGGGLWVEVYANHVLLMSDGKCGCPCCTLNGKAEDRESQSPSSSASRQKNIWKTTSEAALSVVNEKTQAVVNEKTQAPLDCDNSADRIPHKPFIIIARAWSSGGPRFHHRWLCATGTADSTFSGLLQLQGTTSAAAPCSLKMEASCCVLRLLCCVEDVATGLLPGTVKMETPTKGARPTQTSSQRVPLWPISHFPTSPRSSHGLLPGTPRSPSFTSSQSGSEILYPPTQHPPVAIPARNSDNSMNPVLDCSLEMEARAPPNLGFCVHMASGEALCLMMDFRDSSGVEMRLHIMSEAMAVTAYHQYSKGKVFFLLLLHFQLDISTYKEAETQNITLKVYFCQSENSCQEDSDPTNLGYELVSAFVTKGIYMLKAVIYNEFHGTKVELGPYYVEIGHEAMSAFMNSSSVHEDEVLVFADSQVNQKSTVVIHHFPSIPSYNVSFISQTQVGDSQAWHSMTVWYKMQSVSVYTNGTVFATDTDITFTAVTKETIPLEFEWYFGEDPPVRTTSRSITKRLSIPQWYRVMVKASSRISSVVSEPHVIRVQKKIVANRLTSPSSALVNASVAFECRINFGTDVAYLWDFGDGTVSLGSSSSSHVYSREGEFTVEVLAFNNVSASTLRKQLFVVCKPCQPPLVKNMGPGKVQIWRSQPVRLGVTFQAAVFCDISQGLSYTWNLMDSEGLPVSLPAAVDTRRQTLILPSHTLEYGNYTALAKVQIEGSVVYSNYCVGLEVRAQAPVSVISEGTHLFFSRTTSSPIVLRGTQSFHPDNPRATLRYHWECATASSPAHPCFDSSSAHQLDATAPTVSFEARWLSASYDQFLVMLRVSSGGRNSSEARVFLSPYPDSAFRFVHISWVSFRDTFVNWNDELSLQAMCEDCGEIPNLSYSWDLFLVNATEKNRIEVPFCRVVGLLGSLGLGAISKSSQLNLLPTEPGTADPDATTTPFSREPSPMTLGQPAPSAPRGTPTEPMTGVYWIPAAGGSAVLGEAPEEGSLDLEPGPHSKGSLMTGPSERSQPTHSPDPHLSDFEAYYSDIQEAIPSGGRQPEKDTSFPGSGPSLSAEESPGDGDNLVDPSLSAGRAEPVLMIDWPKALLGRAVFQGYSSSGITEQTVTIKPYSLSSGETYVLQASVASKHGLLGKAQLYLTVNPAPRDMACQVQPHHGLEAHTVFSVFCMSGKPDFHYEFSYQIGNASKHTLYHGRDTQYYFVLPAGEHLDNYKVAVSTEITDGEGSKIQPCTVVVTVLPRYHGNDCLGEDLYNSSLKNLSTLQLMGSYTEIRNYITVITRILSRLSKEDKTASCNQWSRIQDALISSVCKLAFVDQEEMIGSVFMLTDLVSFSNKLSFMSAVLILKYTRALLAQGQFSGQFVVDKGVRLELISLISRVWEVSEQENSKEEGYLHEEGITVISDLLLGCLSLNHVSTGQMEFRTLLHYNLQSSVQSLGSVQVHLPGDLAGHNPAGAETQSPCYISQLILSKKNPYPGGQAPGQIGGVVGLNLYTCSSRRPINRQWLRKPVMVEFGKEDGLDNRRNKTTFVLLRDKVNLHQFTELSENPQESLQIEIEFSKPVTRAFPVMLLVRFSEKPTPSDFLVKQIYFWDESIVQIYIPAASQKDANVGYLSLLDADYDRKPPNRYLAKAVNYTVHFQWIRCLFWDKREWKSEHFSPQPGTSPEKVNCSYHRLAAFTLLRRKLKASFEVSEISKLQSHPENLLPSIFIMGSMILYGFLVARSRQVDHHEKKKAGYIFLQEAPLPGHQLYAVVIDTGFRAPARLTSKVYIVLSGDNGLSETKELTCPEKPLFERNSRHTFILSAPAQLGLLRKIRLWHDSRGPSPGWFISHVMVKELRTGQGWFFPAQCWLSASRHDGRVERELTCLQGGLGFRKLFYCKFTEYLEDFHVWLSVYSRPSSSRYLHTPRLTVSFSLLCVYACLTALVAAGGQEQHQLDVSPTLGSFRVGLLCTLLASPGAQLLSLLFRLSKEAPGSARAEPHSPLRGGAQTEAPHGPNSWRRIPDAQEPCKHPASAVLSGSGRAQRNAASDDGTACPAPKLEAHGADHNGTALMGKSHCCPPRTQAPSSGLEGLRPQRSSAPQPWWSFAVWAICGTTSLACSLGTGFLGYRFGQEQCVQWLHLLSLSVVCCVFITQPLMVCLMALGFAWKRRADNHFFTESLCEATRDLDSELAERSWTCLPFSSSCSIPDCAGEIEKVLAARQQARHLRWAHPPSKAQLRVTRERMRRESRTWAALRDISMDILMLLLLLCVVYGRFSQDEYSLNQAIRKEFIRNARNSLGGLRNIADWWDWSLTTLLDGLYPGGTPSTRLPGAQPGALGGKCYLIGSSVIRQLKVFPNHLCKLPRPFSALIEDSIPTCSPEVGGPENPYLIDPENQNMTLNGPGGCGAKEDCVLSLGRTRPEAHTALSRLRASTWIDRSTRAVSVHFTLYNPPTQLFTSVSLSVEILPTGSLVPSSLVESFSIFRSNSALQYHLMLPQLVFLALSLIHLCVQLYRMMDKGVLSYWRKPSNWLELSVVGVSLTYYAVSGHLATLAGDVTDQFHRGLCQAFMDLTLMASWNQRARWLRGILLFLFILKCVYLPGIRNTMASCSSMTHHSLPSIFVAGLVGALMLAALSHLHRFLLSMWVLPPGTFTDAFPGLLFHFPRRSQKDSLLGLSKSDQRAMACYFGILLIVSSTLCFGMLRGFLMTLPQKRKSFQSKSFMRLKDVTAYMWEKVLTFLRLKTPKLEEAEMVENHNYYLDEFANLLDELLMKINGLSDSLQLPLLEKISNSTGEARTEESPLVDISSYQATEPADIKDF